MKELRRKLTFRSGETLTETLCALLAVALASVALAAMLSVANRLNASAAQRDETLYRGVTAAETRSGPKEKGFIYIQFPGEDNPRGFFVDWYGADGLWAYAVNVSAPGEGGGAP